MINLLDRVLVTSGHPYLGKAGTVVGLLADVADVVFDSGAREWVATTRLRKEPSVTTDEINANFTTGDLRAALQPVVFIELTEPIDDDPDGFSAGTRAAAQYWGQGRVKLTRIPDGHTVTPVAHKITGKWLQ